jgi:hypothetical protein
MTAARPLVFISAITASPLSAESTLSETLFVFSKSDNTPVIFERSNLKLLARVPVGNPGQQTDGLSSSVR